MTIRALVAIDDSTPALAAAALAIELATGQPFEINFTTVSEPGSNADAILGHVANLAAKAGVSATLTTTDDGKPFEAILATAARWNADVIIIGRSDIRRPGQPYVGSQTEHLLEFTRLPVVVVPYVVAS